MKTIAQQLNIKEFPFEIKNKKGKKIYSETSSGFWLKQEYDSKGNEIYIGNSDGFWYKREYDSKGNEIYFENSDGIIRDNRLQSIPEYTMAELQSMLGKEFKIKK